MRARAAAALLAAALLLAPGCIIVPTPEHGLLHGRGAITPADTAWVRVGATTREEVLLHFGEPEACLEGGRILCYRWSVAHGYYLVGGYAVGYAGPIAKFYLLLFTFDDEGAVTRWALAQCLWRTPESVLRAWAEGRELPEDKAPPEPAEAPPPDAPAPGR